MTHQPVLAAVPDQTAIEITRLSLTALQASSALFYWVEDGTRMADVTLAGLSAGFYLNYAAGMEETDPSNVRRMADGRHNVTQLCQPHRTLPREAETYSRFLNGYGVTDVIDLMFWSDGIAVAGIGILKRRDDPPASEAALNTAAALQRYMEFNLQGHRRLAGVRRRRALAANYQLTLREIEVAECAASGLSNREIAEALSMKSATVKSHLLRIFGKTGCSSRTKLARTLSG